MSALTALLIALAFAIFLYSLDQLWHHDQPNLLPTFASPALPPPPDDAPGHHSVLDQGSRPTTTTDGSGGTMVYASATFPLKTTLVVKGRRRQPRHPRQSTVPLPGRPIVA